MSRASVPPANAAPGERYAFGPIRASLFGSADAAFKLGFLGDTMPNLDSIYDLTLLNQVLKEKGLATVQ